MRFIAASLVVLISSSASALFAADEGKHIVISSTVLRTLAITAPLPEYPASSIAAGHEGRAVVVLTYDERGVPNSATLLEAPDSAVGEATRVAVLRWRFRPMTVDGHRVASQTKGRLIFYFLLRPGGPSVTDAAQVILHQEDSKSRFRSNE